MKKKLYSFFLSKEEAQHLLETKNFSDAFERFLQTPRPYHTEYRVLILPEKDQQDLYFLIFVFSSKFPRALRYIMSANEALMSHLEHYLISETSRQRIMTRFEKNFEALLKHFHEKKQIERKRRQQARLQQQRKRQEQQLLSFYSSEIDRYVSHLERPIQKKHFPLKQIVERRRQQLIQKYVKDPLLPLTTASRANREIIKAKRKQYEQELIDKYLVHRQLDLSHVHPTYRHSITHAREKQQRQAMMKQDVIRLPRHVEQLVSEYKDDIETLTEQLLWKQLGLLDPISLQAIQHPVVLPSSFLMDRQSVKIVRQTGKDPMTNQTIPENTHLQVNRDLQQVLTKIRSTTKMIQSSPMDPRLKANALLKLKQTWQPTIDSLRKNK